MLLHLKTNHTLSLSKAFHQFKQAANTKIALPEINQQESEIEDGKNENDDQDIANDATAKQTKSISLKVISVNKKTTANQNDAKSTPSMKNGPKKSTFSTQ